MDSPGNAELLKQFEAQLAGMGPADMRELLAAPRRRRGAGDLHGRATTGPAGGLGRRCRLRAVQRGH
jgi:hypothetical protein